MIAPLRETETRTAPEGERLREAHRFVAETLLEERRRPAYQAPRIPTWQAWLFTGWVVVTVVVYAWSMLGWL